MGGLNSIPNLEKSVHFNFKNLNRLPKKISDTLKLNNGDYFIGKVVDGNPSGQGEYYYIDPVDGQTVLAYSRLSFFKSKPPSLAGIKTTVGTYFGKMVHSKAEGQGRILYKDGIEYSGNFHEGYPEGQGQLILPKGYSYTGSFVRGVETIGKLTYPNNTTFTGSFVNQIPFSGSYKLSNGTVFNPSYLIQANEIKAQQFTVNPNRPINQNRNVEQLNELAGNYRSSEDFNLDIPNSSILKIPVESPIILKEKF